MENKNRVVELEELITVLDTAFDISGNEEDCINPKTGKVVSNAEYDSLRKELKKLNPKSTIFDKVTASKAVFSSRKTNLTIPFTSISKANGTLEEKNETLADWIEKCSKELNYVEKLNPFIKSDYIVMSYKHDGVAINLNYVDGILTEACLRPHDGLNNAEICTENAIHVQGIPSKLPLPLTLTIRGELECKISVFEELNKKAEISGEQIYANPRNYTSGSIRQYKDPEETKKRKLSFTAYSIFIDNPSFQTEVERAKWCITELGIPFVEILPYEYEKLKEMEDNAKNLDYEVDGIVLSINNLEDQSQLGVTGSSVSGPPKGKIAWKFEEQSATPEVKTIRWQTGRTGRVTPVLEFEPVSLAGTMVKQCTAHNVGIVISKGLGIGSKIRIIKSGKIIPKVIDVLTKAKKIEYPKTCPSCGQQLKFTQDEEIADLCCENKIDCPAQNIGNLVNYLSVIDAKGCGEAFIEKMIEAGLVKRIADFYTLTIDELKTAGFGDRQSLVILASIFMIESPEHYNDIELSDLIKKTRNNFKLKITLQKFIQSLGIENASKGTGKTLSDYYQCDFDKIRNATEKELINVPEIGPITAKNLVDYFKNQEDNLNDLLEWVEIEKPKTGKLSGMTFVFTGTLSSPRKELEKMVENAGGKIGSSVSKSTSILVAGSDAGSKLDKAGKLGIKVIDENEFLKMV